jgi:putative transposase
MPKKGHTEEQILAALQQAESGEKVEEVCRRMGISQATYYSWKKQYAGLGIAELRELRQLREENARLKRLVADLSLDRQILQEIVSKRCEASSATQAGEVGASSLPDQRATSCEADEAGAIESAV